MSDKTDNISDNHLVSKIRNEDKDAFKSLYNRYSKKVYYFSLRFLQNNAEAEDLVQSVFINIWVNRKSLDITQGIRNYIYKSAVNYIYNYLKKKTVRLAYYEKEIYKGEAHSEPAYDQLFLRDLEKSLNSIIETLPLQQQQIFRLSRIEGLTHEEIAEKLNLSIRTVENHIYRALKIIKKKL